MISRRVFLIQGAALAAGGCANAANGAGVGSVYDGIPIGVITYSYRGMPVGRYKTLEYVRASGLSEMEFMSNDLEIDACLKEADQGGGGEGCGLEAHRRSQALRGCAGEIRGFRRKGPYRQVRLH